MGRLGLLMLLASTAHAESYSSFMCGVFNSGKESMAEVKMLNLGYREPLLERLTQQVEVGGWTDTAGKGRRGSVYGAYQVGVEAGEGVVARAMVGPAIIGNTDNYLGGHFQFTEDFALAFRGKNGNVVGVKYKHVSSAGIYQPNEGRDFFGIEAGIGF